MKRFKKIFLRIVIGFIILILAILIYFKLAVQITPPKISYKLTFPLNRIKSDTNFYTLGNNWFRKSKSGLWEMYIEGKPYERGVITGILAKELIFKQEKAFVNQFDKMVPNKHYLSFLRYFVAWFNRNLDQYTENEFQQEIYGISQSASDTFNFIGPKFQRMLNYHAAHDIGHALQNYHMVGCTSFAAWGNATEDSTLIIGRNFDFYVGDEFARNKIVCFVNPDKGYRFLSVTWAGMTGVVSGMNEKGLTVTLNAAKSDIPLSAATPISLISREVLQYAKNIDEAYTIIKKRKSFVSESFLIGSSLDHRCCIIEKSPSKIGIFFSPDNRIICTNHFQSTTFIKDKLNIENIQTSATQYRYERVNELLNQYQKLNVSTVATILRDQKGLNNSDIGMGNEKAINQLIAHHSIIFKPEQLQVWVSTSPYQLGQYIAYDLKKIFFQYPAMKTNHEINEEQLNIKPDTFLFSQGYSDFKTYLLLRDSIKKTIMSGQIISINNLLITELIQTNPEYYYSYSLAGDYFKKLSQFDRAIIFYNLALTKEINTIEDKKHIIEGLRECFINK